MTERWRDIKGYEGLYQVSDLGRVKSLNCHRSGKEKILKPVDNGKGYKLVHLVKEKRLKWKSVHRLVAESFIINNNNKPTVNHIDGNRANNKVDNLEWATYSENNIHSYRCNGRKHPLSKPIICVETGEKYMSSYDASRITGICQPSINRCANGMLQTAGGLHWNVINRKEKIYVN